MSTGNPGVERKPLRDRLAAKLVVKPNGCWEFEGATGYGRLYDIRVGRQVGAHRIAWELANGPVPEGKWVLHHCDNMPCCNPEHLFLGDNDANVADKMTKGRHTNGATARTHCLAGHEYTPENTSINRHGHRNCKRCRSLRNKRNTS